jgi:Mg2+ and Co2+ transporter CorA
VIALNRAEFRSALDPRDDNRLAARQVIEEQLRQYQERFDEVSRTPDEQALALLPAAREAFAAYKAQLDTTLDAVEAEKSSKLSDSADKLRDVAMNSREICKARCVRSPTDSMPALRKRAKRRARSMSRPRACWCGLPASASLLAAWSASSSVNMA